MLSTHIPTHTHKHITYYKKHFYVSRTEVMVCQLNRELGLQILLVCYIICHSSEYNCQFQWSSGLRCGSTAAGLLKLQIRIPLKAWMSVCCECCVLSSRVLCIRLINHPEESCGSSLCAI